MRRRPRLPVPPVLHPVQVPGPLPVHPRGGGRLRGEQHRVRREGPPRVLQVQDWLQGEPVRGLRRG